MKEEDPAERLETSVLVEEVGLREGLQSSAANLTLAQKTELVDLYLEAGLRQIQLGSFVNPKRVPQMTGIDELFHHYRSHPGVLFSALVLNRKGLERAVECGVGALNVSLSASESHQRENAGRSIAESLAELSAVIRTAKQLGIYVKGGIQAVFGCYLEGPVPIDQVLRIASTLQEAGADEINLADTAGFARPGQIRQIVAAVQRALPNTVLGLHLHNTLGMGYANVMAALDLGVRNFDSAAAGVGGCPFMPGAAGNIATEDLVFLLQSLGLVLDLDLGRLCQAAARTRQCFGTGTHGAVGRHYPRLRELGLVH